MLLVGGTAASGVALATFALTHPGPGTTPAVLLPAALGAVLDLVQAACDVVLVVRLGNAAPRARGVLTAWLGLAGLVALGGVVTSLVGVAEPSVPFLTRWSVQLVLCLAAVVLLLVPGTTAWLRSRSVRPARPGL